MIKPILDVTCGSRAMWFDKYNPACLYLDNRIVDTRLCDGRKFEVKPDIVADFRTLPFGDNTFYLVVFDPPHLVYAGDKSFMAIKFGKLDKDWGSALKRGVDECMRVLKPGGTLIFKWSEYQIPVKDILNAIHRQPLFGHRSGKQSKTHWMCFLKEVS